MEVLAHLTGSNLGFLCKDRWQDPAISSVHFVYTKEEGLELAPEPPLK